MDFDLKSHIRSIPDWPKPGVIFRDINSLLEDRLIFHKLIDCFVHRYLDTDMDAIAAVDARGFMIGAAAAYQLNTALVPVRKKGKLPGETISEAYTLEYGEAELAMQTSSLKKGSRIILMDDIIATGGTLLASAKLIRRLGAEIIEIAAIIDLPDLGGSKKLLEAGFKVHTLTSFDGE
ncbi:MAG: adenine phosphoribosyltransferase [Deltaproteobacteria bacterium]|nr:MAG: adenine phosphoribosyltransferase [Deltaproteobacteria bacterium]